jgi:TolA-binding protein
MTPRSSIAKLCLRFPLGPFLPLLMITGCFTPAKERQLHDEIFGLQTRVMQLEGALMDENTPAGEAAKRRLASTAADIEKISNEMNRIKGELDALKLGVSTGFMPGVEGDQSNSVGGKIRSLSERMATLESTQGDVVASLEKQGVNLKSPKKSEPTRTAERTSDASGDRSLDKPSEKVSDNEKPASVEEPRKSDKSLATLKQFRDAYGKRQFKRVIEDAPAAIKLLTKVKDREEVAFLHAEALYKLGQMREAALQFNEFIDSKPAAKYLPQARLRMGDAFRNLGDPATAKIYYQELITKHPKSPEATKAKDRLKELGKSARAGH